MELAIFALGALLIGLTWLLYRLVTRLESRA
jgi:hypothetical protein